MNVFSNVFPIVVVVVVVCFGCLFVLFLLLLLLLSFFFLLAKVYFTGNRVISRDRKLQAEVLCRS